MHPTVWVDGIGHVYVHENYEVRVTGSGSLTSPLTIPLVQEYFIFITFSLACLLTTGRGRRRDWCAFATVSFLYFR